MLKKDESLKTIGNIYIITGFGGDVKLTKMVLNDWPEGLDFQPHGMDIEKT